MMFKNTNYKIIRYLKIKINTPEDLIKYILLYILFNIKKLSHTYESIQYFMIKYANLH